MAKTNIEINATAAQLEEVALAEKWDREKIFWTVHPQGSIIFLVADLNSDQLNTLFGLTGPIWEKAITFEGVSGLPTIYGYRVVKKKV